MENLKVKDLDFNNHAQKCRICFKSFLIDEHRVNITNVIEKKFLECFTKLKLSTKFSKEICVVCNYQLTVFSQAKRNVQQAQRMLLKYEAIKTRHPADLEEAQSVHCDSCGFIADSKSEIISHFESHKSSNSRQESDSSKGLKKWVCHHCKRSFSGGGSLTNHIAIYHIVSPNIELECLFIGCNKKFKTKKQLMQHKKIHDEDKQICPECGIIVVNKHNLTKHIRRIHLKMYKFICDFCDYRGFFKFNIEQHMQTHLCKSEREKFHCTKCSFISISKISLRNHNRMEHLNQKKIYTCQCGKTFTQGSSFLTHMKVVHEKLKNHSCHFCIKAFAEKSQLKNHIKSQHLKQKDIPCVSCKKLFSTEKHLAAHMKYHKNPKYECEYENCNNLFYTSTQLKSHIKIHKNLRDQCCLFCDKKYFHRSHLKKHMLKHNNPIRQ